MQDKILFEYATIRYVPRVHREEFVNVGVILFCAKKKFLQMKFNLEDSRIKALWTLADVNELELYLNGMVKICQGADCKIGLLSIAERFRWLTATRSSTLQCGKVHPGLCLDPETTLEKIFLEMVVTDTQ